jgi:hypothetical protein
MNIFVGLVVLVLAFVITGAVNYEKTENRHHYLWFIVSLLSIIAPLPLISVVGWAYTIAWYVGFGLGVESAIYIRHPNHKSSINDLVH